MNSHLVTCGKCGAQIEDDTQLKEQLPCSACGSKSRNVHVTVTDSMTTYDSLGTKQKDPARRSKDKLRVQTFSGYEHSHLLGRVVEKNRIIDRDNDRYYEQIVDPKSKEIIHHCDEKLSKHQGHGNAKKKP